MNSHPTHLLLAVSATVRAAGPGWAQLVKPKTKPAASYAAAGNRKTLSTAGAAKRTPTGPTPGRPAPPPKAVALSKVALAAATAGAPDRAGNRKIENANITARNDETIAVRNSSKAGF